jgi:hypothetical protein
VNRPLKGTQREMLAALAAALGNGRTYETPTGTFVRQDDIQAQYARQRARKVGHYAASRLFYGVVRSRLKRLEARGLVREWSIHGQPRWTLTAEGAAAVAESGL